MKIKIEQLAQIFNKYSDIRIMYLNDIRLRGRRHLSNDLVLKEHLRGLAAEKHNAVEVYYDQTLYETLSYEFPADYRRAYGRMGFMEIDKHLELLDSINAQNGRKRFLYMVGDRYGIDQKQGVRSTLLEHDEKLDYKKWNVIKRNFSQKSVFHYRNSEVPIIIFVNLTDNATSDYVERFKKNTDLISILVSYCSTSNAISPDFVATEDVISVTNPEDLLDTYIRTDARLIVIGENIDDSYKEALVRVKKYDKYVRMMVVPTIDYKNRDHFIRQVRLVYNSNRWSD